ncbi:MAG: hypothetical protein ABS69_16400 [Nitrosomonadales bacterium SCN 54-20]|nr:MAG: hypothetical protein ABS69_16400 [Nitrosomonadales bacterium SCN 54-20]
MNRERFIFALIETLAQSHSLPGKRIYNMEPDLEALPCLDDYKQRLQAIMASEPCKASIEQG